MAQYKLHCFCQSGNSYKAALYLNCAGLDWEPVFVDFLKDDQTVLTETVEMADGRGELAFDLPWEAGDVVLVDNFVAMHGRRAFTGTRKVLASLVAV